VPCFPLSFYNIKKLLAFSLLLLVLSSLANAFDATLEPPATSAITGLLWKSYRVELDIRDVNAKERIYARLQGTFRRPGWTLIIGDRVVRPDSLGRFDVAVPVAVANSMISVYTISDFGKSEKSNVDIKISPSDLSLIRQKSRWLLSAGLGLTSLNYQQTEPVGSGLSNINLNQITTTAKFSVARDISRNQRWFGTFSGYFDFSPISDSSGANLCFLGLNGRIDYSVPFVSDPWKLNIAFGWYYVTSFGSDNYGFANVNGPQIYPSVRYYFKSENFLSGYAKYSPVVSSAAFLPFGSREEAIGLGYGIQVSSQHQISFNLDFATLRLVLDQSVAQTRTITLGLSYTL
jgi:hypothetical protein